MYHETFVKNEVVLTEPYLCLHHECAMHAQIVDNAEHIHAVFPFNLEEETINGYEGTCSSDTGAECGHADGSQRRREDQMRILEHFEAFTNNLKQKGMCL